MSPAKPTKPRPAFTPLTTPDTRLYVGDTRTVLPALFPPCTPADHRPRLVFADPPFNWNRDYDRHNAGDAWDDAAMSDDEYLDFTRAWLDASVDALHPHGSLWINIPDDWAAEIVVHLKHERRLAMINWCVWHYRFGQNTLGRFINSKVHVLYFAKDKHNRTWNTDDILEPSDRATTYFDPRTHNKKKGRNGLRVPLDVWYGKFWGRIQGNNKERRPGHDNQIPEVYLERVIRACSNPGDLVLDPFCGSGTTSTVARALGRPSVTIEYARSNATSAWDRITSGPLRVSRDRPTVHINPIFQPRRAT